MNDSEVNVAASRRIRIFFIRNGWLRFQNPRAAGQCFSTLNYNSTSQFFQGFARGNFFNLRPILALVRVARMQEFFIPLRLVAQQQQAFGIRIEPADGIDIFWKIKVRQRTVWRAVARELRQHAVRFVECNEHWRKICHRDAENTEKNSR